MYMFIGEMIDGGLFYFLGFNRENTNKKEKPYKGNQIIKKKFIQTHIAKATTFSYRRISILFLFATLDYIGSICFNFIGTADFNYLMRSLQLFIYALLSVKMLRYKVYRHKYLSMTLIVIGVLVVNIYFRFKGFEWYWIPLSFICNSFYSIIDIGAKWLMLNRHFNPMLMQLLIGAFGESISILVLIGSTIYCHYDESNNHCRHIDYFYKLTIDDVYYIPVYVIGNACLNVLIFQTNYYFMPTLLVVGNVLSSFVIWVYDSIEKAELEGLALVGYIIVIIGALVYNEIIILHCWGMDFDTKQMIELRSFRETMRCQEQFNALTEKDEKEVKENNQNSNSDNDRNNGEYINCYTNMMKLVEYDNE